VKNVDGCENDESGERNAKSAADVECAFAEEVAAVRYAEQDDKPHRIWRYGPEIGLDDRKSEALDDLRQKVRGRAERYRVGEGDDAPGKHLPRVPLLEAFSHVEFVGAG